MHGFRSYPCAEHRPVGIRRQVSDRRRPHRQFRAESGRDAWFWRCTASLNYSVAASTRIAERAKAGSKLFNKQSWLFPGREVTALAELVIVDQLGIGALGPAPRSRIEFVREDAHGDRDGDAFRIEVPFAPILPIETSARKRCVRQPGDRDVVENVVAREAFGFSCKDP